MAPEKYAVFNVRDGKAYVRKDRAKQLRSVDAVVFDCDGVLIDIRDSYNKAISKAVTYILGGLTGYAFPESLASDEIIFLFRKSGGFNNDWDTVYGILMFTLSNLPFETREELRKHMQSIGRKPNAFERFSSMEEAAKKETMPEELSSEFFEALTAKLEEFAELLDASGTDSVDRNLVEAPDVSEDFLDFYNCLKRFLHCPEEVGRSIIATVFEEFFCGAKLFQETYSVEPRFNTGPGVIENERLIVRPETLDRLTSVLGKANLGIASGSRFGTAEYVLGDLLKRFSPTALVFLEIMEENESLQRSVEGLKVNLKKPHPFSLLKAAKAFGNFNFALYVGDSMEDAIMVREANDLDERFLFAGVYRYSGLEDIVLQGFLESGCDLVVPSVNELPFVLEAVRREKS